MSRTVAIYQKTESGIVRVGTFTARKYYSALAITEQFLQKHPHADPAQFAFCNRSQINGQWVDNLEVMTPFESSSSMEWVAFCERTEDPKLSRIERELDKLLIEHRRNGSSFHAAILEVRAKDEIRANTILQRRLGRHMLDDVRDDHPRWQQDLAESN